MKPENVLLDCAGRAKLADFGFARLAADTPPLTSYISTRWYRAPELMLKFTRYGSEIDVFALGCLLVELYRCAPLFDGDNELDQLGKLIAVLGSPPRSWTAGRLAAQRLGIVFPDVPRADLAQFVPGASPAALDLLGRMLQFVPEQRIGFREMRAHPFFAPPPASPARPLAQSRRFSERLRTAVSPEREESGQSRRRVLGGFGSAVELRVSRRLVQPFLPLRSSRVLDWAEETRGGADWLHRTRLSRL